MTEAERIGMILRSLAPESNRSGWIAEKADAMEMGESSFKSAFYGKSAPDAANIRKLQIYFGVAFCDPYLDGTGCRAVPVDSKAAANMDRDRDDIESIIAACNEMRARRNGGRE